MESFLLLQWIHALNLQQSLSHKCSYFLTRRKKRGSTGPRLWLELSFQCNQAIRAGIIHNHICNHNDCGADQYLQKAVYLTMAIYQQSTSPVLLQGRVGSFYIHWIIQVLVMDKYQLHLPHQQLGSSSWCLRLIRSPVPYMIPNEKVIAAKPWLNVNPQRSKNGVILAMLCPSHFKALLCKQMYGNSHQIQVLCSSCC